MRRASLRWCHAQRRFPAPPQRRHRVAVGSPELHSQPCRGRFFSQSKCLGAGIHYARVAREKEIAGHRCAELFDHLEAVQIDHLAKLRAFFNSTSEIWRRAEVRLQKSAYRGVDLEAALDAEQELLFFRPWVCGNHAEAGHDGLKPCDRLRDIRSFSLWPEIDAADLRIGRRNSSSIAIARRGTSEVVGVQEARVERPAQP